ncbi:MAG: MBL fold metallo-hydrolase [Burkholderiaceae bacterium]
MQFASLGSGSKGNGLLVRSSDGARTSTVLIDCGFGPKEALARMQALDFEPSSLDAILVTHEHGDHFKGVYSLGAAHQIPVYMTHGTHRGTKLPVSKPVQIEFLTADCAVTIGAFSVTPVPVPHDSREPVQFVLDDGRCKLGALTDLGHGTSHVVKSYSGLEALILECNHDPQLLANNDRYPPSLKRRVGGPYGHLSNGAAAQILAQLDTSRLRHLVAAHLSADNNTPALAVSALAGVDGIAADDVRIADQEKGLHWSTVAS